MTAVDDYPGELTLHETGRGWILSIESEDVWGECYSSSREFLLAITECYAAMRRDQAAAVEGAPVPPVAEPGRAPFSPVAETRPGTPGGGR